MEELINEFNELKARIVQVLEPRIEALEHNQALLVQHAKNVRFNGASVQLSDELLELIGG